jgi:hypothetical protein
MRVLTLEHADFEMVVECNNIHSTFQKARMKQRNISSSTYYTATDSAINLLNIETNELERHTAKFAHPLFFENKDYFVGVSFKKPSINNAGIFSRLREVQEKFFYRQELRFLAGTINFGNDLGRSELVIRYQLGSVSKEAIFQFEVFPTKLDYRPDFERIVADIEEQYPYLVLDFLKKTYTAFTTGSSPNTDLIWWQVFGGLYKDFLKASQFVLNKPHRRIVKDTRYVKADRLIQWDYTLEEKFRERRHFPDYRYRAEIKTLSSDTPENRFFKHALTQTSRRYKKVRGFIEVKFGKQISGLFRDEMADIGRRIDLITRNPFLNGISEFTGIRQESLLLQKGTGYSSIYRSWIMLNRGLKFLEGIQKIELKNIADLYQIWCFLEVKGIVQRLLGKDAPDDVKIAEIQVDDFVFRIEKGAKSRVSFVQSNGDLVDLLHDFTYDKGNVQEVRSFTVVQRPDIVLRITKNDLRDNYVLTYLYDAKYRLQSDDNLNGPDLPPEDAINQMHRYRDAIYYHNRDKNRPEKEVIGAYILFPGSGDLDQIRNSEYFRSIESVNIGAFPLRPNDCQNRVLLEQHLCEILGIDTESTLNEVSPQKLSGYEAFNPEVLIGYVREGNYESCFKVSDPPIYYTGERKPARFGYSSLKYFAPYVAGIGISEYFEILRYEIVSRDQIFSSGHPLFKSLDKTERLVLTLGRRFSLTNSESSFKINGGPPRPYKYSKLSLIRSAKDGKIESI